MADVATMFSNGVINMQYLLTTDIGLIVIFVVGIAILFLVIRFTFKILRRLGVR